MTTFECVGFIGLGGMGRGLVKNLVAKGVAVTACDLDPAAVAVAKSFGATAASLHRESCTAVIKAYEAVTGVEARVAPKDRKEPAE